MHALCARLLEFTAHKTVGFQSATQLNIFSVELSTCTKLVLSPILVQQF